MGTEALSPIPKRLQTMATLILTGLECVRKHDLAGKDEPELWNGSTMVGNWVMEKGDSEDLDERISFTSSVKLELKERGNPDRSKHDFKSLGFQTFTKDDRGSMREFKTTGAHYKLFYSVRP